MDLYFVIAVVATVVQFGISYLVHRNGSSYYKSRAESGKCVYPKVYDLGHRYLPDLSQNKAALWMSDIMAIVPLVVCYVLGLDTFYKVWLAVMVFRWLTMSATILPRNKHCDDSSYGVYNLFIGHCYDKVFSGHFAATFLFSLVLYHAGVVTHIPALALYNGMHAWIILATRSHYTIDLIVAALVVFSAHTLMVPTRGA